MHAWRCQAGDVSPGPLAQANLLRLNVSLEASRVMDEVTGMHSGDYKALRGCSAELDGFAEGRAVREVLIQLVATGDAAR